MSSTPEVKRKKPYLQPSAPRGVVGRFLGEHPLGKGICMVIALTGGFGFMLLAWLMFDDLLGGELLDQILTRLGI